MAQWEGEGSWDGGQEGEPQGERVRPAAEGVGGARREAEEEARRWWGAGGLGESGGVRVGRAAWAEGSQGSPPPSQLSPLLPLPPSPSSLPHLAERRKGRLLGLGGGLGGDPGAKRGEGTGGAETGRSRTPPGPKFSKGTGGQPGSRAYLQAEPAWYIQRSSGEASCCCNQCNVRSTSGYQASTRLPAS